MLLKLHAKLVPGWALIRVNFDPIQEIGPKVGDGRSFVSGPFSRDYGNSVYSHHNNTQEPNCREGMDADGLHTTGITSLSSGM